MIIYMLNINGEIIYGECDVKDYEKVVRDSESRGFAISIIDEVQALQLI